MFKRRKITKAALAQTSSVNKDGDSDASGAQAKDTSAAAPPPVLRLEEKNGELKETGDAKEVGEKSGSIEEAPADPAVVVRAARRGPGAAVATTSGSAAARQARKAELLATVVLPASTSSAVDELPHKKPVATFYTTGVATAAPKSKYGPTKAALGTTARVATQVDYAPDVCKDYKQSGFCGFGDTCKFLHMREDYAAGWKLDREWDEQQTRARDAKLAKKAPGEKAGDAEEQEDNVATVCPLCKQKLRGAVITRECDHVFCESCFLEEFRRTKACAVCETALSGVVQPYKPTKK